MFKWLDFKITNRCNNNCTYCGVFQDPVESQDILSSQIISHTLSDALALKFTHFALLGGEPSLRDDFGEILRPLRSGHEFDTLMVITNMLKFNPNMCREIFKTNAKTAQIVASIDSLKAPNYKNQNPEVILAHVRKIQSIAEEYRHLGNRKIEIHTVISRENLHSVKSHVSFFKEQDIDVSLALVEPFEINANFENVESKKLKYNQFSNRDIQRIIQQLEHLDEENLLDWSNKVLKDYINKYRLNEINNYDGCTAGRHHVVIESDGHVYPCLTESYRRGLNYGNIMEERFRDIYDKMQSFSCRSSFKQTCWDHYLWNKLDSLYQSQNRGNSYTETDIIDPLMTPESLVLELSAKCNLNCRMCGFNEKSGFNGDFMDRDLVVRVLQDRRFFKGLREIRLNGRGESTIHPRFPELLEMLSEKYPHARRTLFTNLMFGNKDLLHDMIKHEVELYISVDSPRRSEYEHIRAGANFGTLKDRLDLLVDYPSKYLVFTLQKGNIDDIMGIGQFARQYNMGLIFNVYRSNDEKKQQAFNDFIKENLNSISESFYLLKKNWLGTSQSLLIPDQIAGIRLSDDISTTVSSANLIMCPKACKEIMIAYNGDVMPCNMFNPVKLGSLSESSLSEIWNGFNNRQFIKTYKNHPYCRNCEYMIEKESN